MNWLIAISFLASVYFIRQSYSRRFSKSIHHGPPPPTYHHGYPYFLPRQNPIFLPERKTFHKLTIPYNFPFHDGNSDDIEELPEIHHHPGSGWGWENSKDEEDDITKIKEIVKFINQFLGVMGPFLFPLPYVLALIPFAIPAIPLSLYLEAREPHHPHPPGGASSHPPNGGTTEHVPPSATPTTTTPRITTRKTTTTSPTTLIPNTDTTPIPTFPTTTEMFLTFPTFPPTTNVPPDNTGTGTGGLDNSSFNESSSGMLGNNSFPDFENIGNMSGIGAPPDFNPVTLFPFTLFLNSSFLGEDYED